MQDVPALLRRCHTARAVVVETAWWQDLLTLPVSQTLSHTVVSCVMIVDCDRDLPAILNETIFAADICLLVCSLLSVVAAACAMCWTLDEEIALNSLRDTGIRAYGIQD